MSARISISFNDGLLFFALGYAVCNKLAEWPEFSSCCRPVHLWVVVSQLSVILFRTLDLICHFVRRRGQQRNNSLEFLLFPSSSQAPLAYWLLVGCLFGGVFPFFVVWTIIGNIWIVQVTRHSPTCLPPGSPVGYFVVWLALCYVWIAAYLLFIVVAVSYEYQSRRVEQSMLRLMDAMEEGRLLEAGQPTTTQRLLENYEELIQRWAHITNMPFVRRGLTREQLSQLPSYHLRQKPAPGASEAICSICIEDFEAGDEVRVLEGCGHLFHKSCIDGWLLRNAVCPNCKAGISTGNYGSTLGDHARIGLSATRTHSTHAAQWPSPQPEAGNGNGIGSANGIGDTNAIGNGNGIGSTNAMGDGSGTGSGKVIGSANNGIESANNGIESANNGIESANNGIESANNGIESGNNGIGHGTGGVENGIGNGGRSESAESRQAGSRRICEG